MIKIHHPRSNRWFLSSVKEPSSQEINTCVHPTAPFFELFKCLPVIEHSTFLAVLIKCSPNYKSLYVFLCISLRSFLISITVEISDMIKIHHAWSNRWFLSFVKEPSCQEINTCVHPTTPIRKLSRNRGLVLQEHSVIEDSPERGDSGSRGGGIRQRKRKFR